MAFFDSLAAKYSEPTPKPGRMKGEKRNRDTPDDGQSNKKKQRAVPPPPDIDNEEFAKLQATLFGGASKVSQPTPKKAKGRKAK